MGQHSADPAVKTIWKMPARHGMAAKASAEISWSTALTCMQAFLKEAGSACAHTTTRLLDVGSKKAFFFLSSSPISSRRCWRTARPAEWPLKHAVSLIHRRRSNSTHHAVKWLFWETTPILCNPDRESRKFLTGLFALRSLIFKRGYARGNAAKISDQ